MGHGRNAHGAGQDALPLRGPCARRPSGPLHREGTGPVDGSYIESVPSGFRAELRPRGNAGMGGVKMPQLNTGRLWDIDCILLGAVDGLGHL